MTSITTEPMAPAQHVAPRSKKSHHLLVAVFLTIVLVALAAVSALIIVQQHNALTGTRADLASMTGQRDGLKKDLGKAKDANAGLRSANQQLTATARKCSVFVPITNHLMKGSQYELKAIQGGMFGSLIWLPQATAEMHTVFGLLDSHQSADGELAALCGPTSVSNS